MKIIVGSTNRVKINAAKFALQPLYPEAVFSGVSVASGISDQPMGDQETRKGAKNRAQAVLNETDADFGVGLEGGVVETEIGMMSSAWCCIITRQGVVSYGGGLHFLLPKMVAERLRKGEELGPLMDELTGVMNSKEKGGAVGTFTGGLVNRTEGYRRLVELATSKIAASEWFSNEK